MKFFIPVFIAFFLASFSGNSQISVDSIKKIHQENLEALVLLKNDGGLIPFKNLDQNSISHLSIGEVSTTSDFDNLLHQYTTIKSFHLPLDANGSKAGEVFKYIINNSDVLIISINGDSAVSYSAVIQDFIKDLSDRVNIIYALFGAKGLVNNSSIINREKAILYTPKINAVSQSLAAQILFGGVGAVGKLKADIAPNYKIGEGIITKGGLRLGYSKPELVGVNGQLLSKKIETIVQMGLDSMVFPGAQVLVAKDGQVIYQKNFGYHTYNKKIAARGTDIYDLASVTKVTTAVPALMRLQDDGLFDVDAKFSTYFPDFKGTNKADLDFRSILAHNAKLKPYIVYWAKTKRKNGKFKWWTFKPTQSKKYPIKITDHLYLHKKYKQKMVRYIKKSPLNKEPGYVYSGLSFQLYPDLVKAQTGKRFDHFLYDTFYKKLGANKLIFNPLNNFPIDEITPTEKDTFFRNTLVHGGVHDEAAAMLSGISGNAGLFGNANDLVKLLQLYLNEGSYGGERFIEKSTMQEFTRCQFCEEGNRRGLGFDKPLIEYDEKKSYVAKSASPSSYGHSGFTGTFFWVDPAENLIVVFLSNRVYPTRANRKLYTMNIRPDIQQAAYDAIW